MDDDQLRDRNCVFVILGSFNSSFQQSSSFCSPRSLPEIHSHDPEHITGTTGDDNEPKRKPKIFDHKNRLCFYYFTIISNYTSLNVQSILEWSSVCSEKTFTFVIRCIRIVYVIFWTSPISRYHFIQQPCLRCIH